MPELVIDSKTYGEHTVLFDEEDRELVESYKWNIRKDKNNYYSRTYVKNKSYYMHRLILGVIDPKVLTDHINHNGLDNRKDNLRTCNASQNGFNSRSHVGNSKHKGVCWIKDEGKWQSYISIYGVKITLGRYNNELEASYAHDIACRYIYGPYANPNHEEEYTVSKINKRYLDYPYKDLYNI